MALWIVTWDGPSAAGRARQEWDDKANAEAQYARKLAAGLNPEIEGVGDPEPPPSESADWPPYACLPDPIDDELAAMRLADQP